MNDYERVKRFINKELHIEMTYLQEKTLQYLLDKDVQEFWDKEYSTQDLSLKTSPTKQNI